MLLYLVNCEMADSLLTNTPSISSHLPSSHSTGNLTPTESEPFSNVRYPAFFKCGRISSFLLNSIWLNIYFPMLSWHPSLLSIILDMVPLGWTVVTFLGGWVPNSLAIEKAPAMALFRKSL